MQKRRRNSSPAPVQWQEIHDDAGAVIGWYAFERRIVTVRRPSGGEKSTHADPGRALGLARIMLTEKTGWY
jgi:hypothetical protein